MPAQTLGIEGLFRGQFGILGAIARNLSSELFSLRYLGMRKVNIQLY